MTQPTVLFGEKAAGVYLYTDIYIYDPENVVSPVDSGKIIPAVGSLIIDNTKGLHNQQYTVVAVDPVTYELTLQPSALVSDYRGQMDRILGYGNELFMLYYSTARLTTESGNVLSLTRLIVDNKLSLFGNHAATYQLVRYKPTGDTEIISRWYTPTGEYRGTAIPMIETGVDGVRKCDGCYTEVEINEGDDVSCFIYNAGGLLIAQVELITKKAHLLNEVAWQSNPVVDMIVEGNQMLADNVLFLHTGQNVHELTLFPTLKYSDGSTKIVAIDNNKGFVYGLDEIRTDIPDMEYDIMVKYFLGDDDIAPSSETSTKVYYLTADTVFKPNTDYYTRTESQSTWVYTKVTITSDMIGTPIPKDQRMYFNCSEIETEIEHDATIHYITKVAKIRIVDAETSIASKISVVPVWDGEIWKLNFLKYKNNRMSAGQAATSDPTSENYVIDVADPSEGIERFNGAAFGVQQKIKLRYKNVYSSCVMYGYQTLVITVRDPSVEPVVLWLMSDSEDSDHIYGSDTAPHIRPQIKFSASKYAIDRTRYRATAFMTESQVFVDNFYTQADPPTLKDEAYMPTPTHFQIKSDRGVPILQSYTVDGATVPGKVPIEKFYATLNLTGTGPSSRFVGKTLVVEFLKECRDGNLVVTETLFGVPVDVVE